MITAFSFFSLARIDFSSAISVSNCGQFLEDFVHREPRQPVQLQFQDGVDLNEAQPCTGLARSSDCPDGIFDEPILLPIELHAFERFCFPAGVHNLHFFVFKEIVQILSSIRPAGGTTNDLDDVVHMIERDVIPEQDVLALFGLAQGRIACAGARLRCGAR